MEAESLYEQDIVLWSEQQAAALRGAARAGSNLSIEWENVAEEIESLGRSERAALGSQLNRILRHLMKLQASPAAAPRRGWVETILDARAEIERVLEASPSLRRELPAMIARELPRARKRVLESFDLYGEQPAVDLAGFVCSEAEVMDLPLST